MLVYYTVIWEVWSWEAGGYDTVIRLQGSL